MVAAVKQDFQGKNKSVNNYLKYSLFVTESYCMSSEDLEYSAQVI